MMDNSGERIAPKIYYFHPLLAGPRTSWPRHLRRCRDMGFDHVLTAPLFAPGKEGDLFLSSDHDRANPAFHESLGVDDFVAEFARACRECELDLLIDVVLGRIAADSQLAEPDVG